MADQANHAARAECEWRIGEMRAKMQAELREQLDALQISMEAEARRADAAEAERSRLYDKMEGISVIDSSYHMRSVRSLAKYDRGSVRTGKTMSAGGTNPSIVGAAAGGVALSRASAQASGVPLPHPTPSCSAMALAKLSSKATVV